MVEKRSKLPVVLKVLLILFFGLFILILSIVVDDTFLEAFEILPWDISRHKKDKQGDVQ